MGDECAFEIYALGEDTEDIGTDFIAADKIQHPDMIDEYTPFVNEVNQLLIEYEQELEG